MHSDSVDAALRDLEMEFAPRGSAPRGGEDDPGQPASLNSAICASLRRVERTQYWFLVLFQTIIAVLGIGTLLLLLFAFVQIARGTTVDGLLEGGAALVTGVAAVWLGMQRTDARTTLDAALKGLDKHNCPERSS
jgi:hypothetical protein